MKRILVIIILLILAAFAGVWFKDALIALMPAPPPAQPAQDRAEPGAPPAELGTPQPAEPQEQPTPEPQQPPAPQPDPRPEPPPAPQPEKPAMPQQLTERPHSAEHAVALMVGRAIVPAAPRNALDSLVEKGRVAPEAAEALRSWAAEHPNFRVEEVGTAGDPGAPEKETRYRLVAIPQQQQEHPATQQQEQPATQQQEQPSAQQQEQPSAQQQEQPAAQQVDAIVTIITPKQGTPYVSRVQTAASDKTQITAGSDAMSVVEGFVEALRRGDMATARHMTTGKDVSDATLAGLCMMFEEGDFAMRKTLPIRNMFRTEDSAGYLVYMSAEDGSAKAGNVGIETTYIPGQGWAVKGVALDNLLTRYETIGEAEGGVYFPIVRNPQGGDSLVLFFGFNDAGLSPRSLSQLKIVAGLLRASKGILNVSGHTDDVGSPAYNQQLSERRAAAVKDALISFGVQADQITTKGLGESQPRRTYRAGDTAQTIRNIRSINRRAEIYLDF